MPSASATSILQLNGWFKEMQFPEVEDGERLWARFSAADRAINFTPMSHCGLAFAGPRTMVEIRWDAFPGS